MPRPNLGAHPLATVALAAALIAAIGVGLVRRASPAHADFERRPYAALDPDADYRSRLLTLALAGSTLPDRDAFVDPAEDRPRGAGARAAASWIAALLRSDPSGPPETGGVDPRRAEAWLARALTITSALAAVVGAALAASWVPPSVARRMTAAVLAAAVVSLSPLAIAREHSSSLSLHSAHTLLAVLQYAALAFAVRGRERVDVTVGALAAGACGAVAFVLGGEAWPTTAACATVWTALALRARLRSEVGRAPFIAAIAFLLVFVACRGELVAWELTPPFDGVRRGWSAMPTSRTALTALAALCVALLLFHKRREPLHAALLIGLLLSAALASLDASFSAGGHAAWAVGAGIVGARPWNELPSRVQRVAWLGLFAAALAASVWTGAAPDDVAQARAERDSVHGALAQLREREPAPGSFNHPRAVVEWRVASSPALAGPIAHRARRPTLAIEFEGRFSPSAAVLPELFALEDPVAFTARAQSLSVRYVLVSASIWSDPACASAARAGTLLARLLDPGEDLPGWSLVFESGRWRAPGVDAELALAALWRRD